MAALSTYAMNKALDHLLGTASWTKPTNTYVQLHTGAPTTAGTANVATTNTRKVASWAAASARSIATNAVLSWTAAGNETITHFTIWDALSTGNCIAYGALTASQAITTGDTFQIASGALTIDFTTVSSAISTYAGNALLEHATGKTSWTAPASVYVQLHIGAPGLAGTSNVAATNTRVVSGGFGAASAGATNNTGAISFTGAATETISHFSLWDASSLGNNLWGDAVTSSKGITSGQTVRFSATALALSMS